MSGDRATTRGRRLSLAEAAGITYDAIVIGGGQAGLAMAWHLRQQGLRFLVLEAGPRVGQVWRSRWDSLTLFSPAQYDALPGLDFPGRSDTYPTKDDVAAYLESYAARFKLPIRLNTRVTGLIRSGEDFEIHSGDEVYRCRQVVVATGPFQEAVVPPVASGLDATVMQLHSSQYRNPEILPVGPVLVVGAGNSGLQIAGELAAARSVDLSVGSSPPALPQRWLGRDLFWWGTRLRLIGKPSDSRIGRRMQARELIIGSSRRKLRRAGVRFRPRLTGLDGASARFEDGTTLDAQVVIWATGFRPHYAWLHVVGVLNEGGVVHDRGVTSVPGLYFLGLSWQHSRGSALLGFVRHDAAHLAEHVRRRAAAGAALSPAAGRRSPSSQGD